MIWTRSRDFELSSLFGHSPDALLRFELEHYDQDDCRYLYAGN